MADSICRWQCPDDWAEWGQWLATGRCTPRNRWRLPVLLTGILFAHGRRTVTTWLRAAGVSPDFQDYYSKRTPPANRPPHEQLSHRPPDPRVCPRQR